MSSDACSSLSIHSAIQQQGIDPDADLLLGSSRATWQDFCEEVVAWNARFAAIPFLAEADAGNNLLTLAAFLGNAAQESADFVACAEYINPCQGVCSGGNSTARRSAGSRHGASPVLLLGWGSRSRCRSDNLYVTLVTVITSAAPSGRRRDRCAFNWCCRRRRGKRYVAHLRLLARC